MLPKTPLGWVILGLVAYLVFRTVGAAAAGVATGHGLHNVGTYIASTLKSL